MLAQDFHIEQTASLAVVGFSIPDLDLLHMQEVTEELMQRFRCDGTVHFLFDLTGVRFLSSSCLGCLVQFLQDIQHVRGRIALCNCHPNVTFLFKVTRLDTIIQLYDDRAQAQSDILGL